MTGQESSMKTNILDHIFSTEYIRASGYKMAVLCQGGATNFIMDESRLPAAADYVIDIIRDRYPDLNVPYHSRWRHFEVGNESQLIAYKQAIQNQDDLEKARTGLDLIFPSVLVDAGTGGLWTYASSNSVSVGRSEGLALASLDAFLTGAFSKNGSLGSHADGFSQLTTEKFNHLFNVSDANPMLGVEGRIGLLKSLGKTLQNKREFFPNQRPGDLVDYIVAHHGYTPTAQAVLSIILQSLGDIWPGRLEFEGKNLGDTWSYAPFGEGVDTYVPLHKLSQWITYSVIETLESNGFTISGLEKLTGLAEYRNGGFMLDFGLLQLRDASVGEQKWRPDSDLIIEWRALTIYLLDKLAVIIQEKLNMNAEQFPLAKILEGGTWMAGRKLAAQKRDNSEPPINIISDGTVF